MRVTVRLFAMMRECAGRSEVPLELGPGATVAQLVEAVKSLVPSLEKALANAAVAVNQRYVKGDAPLREGDEIAFIPPVSGG